MGEHGREQRRAGQPERATQPRPSSGTPEPALLTLQRAVGNRATTALVSGARPVRRRVHRKLDLDAATWDGWFGGVTGWRALREGLQADFGELEDALADLRDYLIPSEHRKAFDGLQAYVTKQAKTPVPYKKGLEVELRREIDTWTGVATTLQEASAGWETKKQFETRQKADRAAETARKKAENRQRAAEKQAEKRREPIEPEPVAAPVEDDEVSEPAEREPAAPQDRVASFWGNFPDLRALYARLDEAARHETDEWIGTEWPKRTKKKDRRAFRGELHEWLVGNQPAPPAAAALTPAQITELCRTYTRAGIEAAIRQGIVVATHTQTYRTDAEAARTTSGDGGLGREFRIRIGGQNASWVFHTHSDSVRSNGHQVHHAKPAAHGTVRFVTPAALAQLAQIDRSIDAAGRNLTDFMRRAAEELAAGR